MPPDISPDISLGLDGDTVHIFSFDLDAHDRPAWSYLSADERERARRFHFEIDHDRYCQGRSQLRTILGYYAQRAPNLIAFRYGTQDKPALVDPFGLHFNLAHSGNLAVLAVARFALGVDVELPRPGFADDEIAERFFAPREVAELRRLAPEQQEAAFFRCWTRKEAYLKALGGGLSIPLDDFTVTFATATEAPAVTWVRGLPTEPSAWTILDISHASTQPATAALATRRTKPPTLVVQPHQF